MPDGTMAITDPAASPLSPEQKAAVADIKAFLSDSTRRVFSVHGLAGVGKSHLLGRIARSSLDPLVATPTGKAAAILRERFDVPAQTIHGLFYRLKSESQRPDGRRDLAFEPRRRDGSLTGRILLIDESSMVTDQLRDQILATGARIIAFGDEGQLPPVNGTPAFPHADFTLRTIHRQAADSPIIRQARAVRSGGDYQSDGPDVHGGAQRHPRPPAPGGCRVVLAQRHPSLPQPADPPRCCGQRGSRAPSRRWLVRSGHRVSAGR